VYVKVGGGRERSSGGYQVGDFLLRCGMGPNALVRMMPLIKQLRYMFFPLFKSTGMGCPAITAHGPQSKKRSVLV
jgi:hypothetical protein